MPDGNDITVRIPETGDVIHFPTGTDQNTIMSAMGKLRVQKLGGVPGAPNGLPQGGPFNPAPQTPLPQGLPQPSPTPPTDKVMLQSGAAGVPIGMDVPKGYGQGVQDVQRKALIGSAATGPAIAGAIANPVGAAIGTSTALLGARVGGSGGQALGSLIGEPQTGRTVGTVIGSLAGGIGGPGALEYLSSRGYLKLLLSSEVNQAVKLGVAKQALAEKPELAESPQDLINRMRKLVIPGESPTAADLKRAGDLTQTPLTKLQILAKFGDRLAQNEVNRRLKQ